MRGLLFALNTHLDDVRPGTAVSSRMLNKNMAFNAEKCAMNFSLHLNIDIKLW